MDRIIKAEYELEKLQHERDKYLLDFTDEGIEKYKEIDKKINEMLNIKTR